MRIAYCPFVSFFLSLEAIFKKLPEETLGTSIGNERTASFDDSGGTVTVAIIHLRLSTKKFSDCCVVVTRQQKNALFAAYRHVSMVNDGLPELHGQGMLVRDDISTAL